MFLSFLRRLLAFFIFQTIRLISFLNFTLFNFFLKHNHEALGSSALQLFSIFNLAAEGYIKCCQTCCHFNYNFSCQRLYFVNLQKLLTSNEIDDDDDDDVAKIFYGQSYKGFTIVIHNSRVVLKAIYYSVQQ